ncbi:transposase, MuDR, MULE transposase domain protein [Tanacetum coccineum]
MAAARRFVHLKELRVLGNSSKFPDQLLIYFDMQTQKEAQLATGLSNLMMQLLQSVNERRAFIKELEHLPGNLVAYKTRVELKCLHKDDLIKVMEMRKELDTAYPGFFGVGTTFDIFQNILFLYLEYDVWKSPGYGVLVFISSWFLVKWKVIEDVGEDDNFTCVSWLSVVEYVNVDGWIVTGFFRDVKKFLKKGKLEKVVAIIKSCTPNTLGDLTVILKDLFGTISGTIHYKVLTEERFAKAITDVLSCRVNYLIIKF